MSKKIGFLPLYLALYDTACPELRPQMEAFVATVTDEYKKRGIEVVCAPICRLENEFAAAVKDFEQNDVDAIVTMHLAYSPSLESADVLAGTSLPLIILDTTFDFNFAPDEDFAGKIMANHGIHGVQDMCNLLLRKEKHFFIEAGHWKNSDVIERTLVCLDGCIMAKAMRRCKAGIIGEPFKGMGDFAIGFDKMKQLIGIDTVSADAGKIRSLMPAPDSPEIDAELANDRGNFAFDSDLDEASVRRTLCAGLAVRKWLKSEKLDAFSMNFLNIDKASGLPCVPFLEASKAMSEKTGYAGEGDILTAALCGAVLKVFSASSFTEMFCPDWEGNRVFLSHMGEINVKLLADKALLSETPFPYTDAENPVIATGRFKPGDALLINLAPGVNDRFSLIVAPVKVCDSDNRDNVNKNIRGWFTPPLDIKDFLAEYSYYGGTHHQLLSYDANIESLAGMAELMNWEFALISEM